MSRIFFHTIQFTEEKIILRYTLHTKYNAYIYRSVAVNRTDDVANKIILKARPTVSRNITLD